MRKTARLRTAETMIIFGSLMLLHLHGVTAVENYGTAENPATFSIIEYTVVINEILANAENEDTGEFVELYNFGDSPVNVSGWFVADPKDSNDKVADYTGEYDFGLPGTTIPPGGFCLYVDQEYRGEYNSLIANHTSPENIIMVTCDGDTTVGNGLTNSGDSIFLYSGDGFEINRSWSSDPGEGVSIGHIPDNSGPWLAQAEITPGFTNGDPPGVVINEFLYNPKGPEASGEWIELFNADLRTIDLTGWALCDSDNNRLSIPHVLLPPGCFFVIHIGFGEDGNDLDFDDGSGEIFFNRTTSMLTNTGDCLYLETGKGLCIDYIAYGNRSTISPPAWYLAWSQNIFESCEGNSLSLYPNGLDSDSGKNWQEREPKNHTCGWNNDLIYNFEITHDEYVSVMKPADGCQVNLNLNNLGTCSDHYEIDVCSTNENWSVEIDRTDFRLEPGTGLGFKLNITSPPIIEFNKSADITIEASSGSRGELKEISILSFNIPTAELCASWLTINNVINEYILYEGDIPVLKGRVKNEGELNSTDFNVSFEIRDGSSEVVHSKIFSYTDLKTKYSKYPKIEWDTLGSSGNYSIWFSVDCGNDIEENNERDNTIVQMLEVFPTPPDPAQRRILITEIYYDTLNPGEPDEYFIIANPQNEPVNISSWRIEDGEGAVAFPDNLELEACSEIIVAYSAENYRQILGSLPDFEMTDSTPLVPDMDVPDYGFKLTNTGDELILRTGKRHIIDTVVYGNSGYAGPGWSGPAIPPAAEGCVLRRNPGSDTNSSDDWITLRENRPGQSMFGKQTVFAYCNITAFVTPDCGADEIISRIRSANSSILISSYLFTSELFKHELIEALKRNVEIMILLSGKLGMDDVESELSLLSLPELEWRVLLELFAHGAKIRFMADRSETGVRARYEHINSKYMVVDRSCVIITTENFASTGFSITGDFGNRGYGIIIEQAEFAEMISGLFESDWGDEKPDTVDFDPRAPVFNDIGASANLYANTSADKPDAPGLYSPVLDPVEINGHFELESIIGPENILGSDTIPELLKSAEKSICITMFSCSKNWYCSQTGREFVNPFLSGLVTAAKRGCDVKVLLDPRGFNPVRGPEEIQSDSNFAVLRFINEYKSYNDINGTLEARFAYLAGLNYLHGNMVVVDDSRVLLGTFPWVIDELSADRELGVLISNSGLGDYFNKIFDFDWNSAPSIFNDRDRANPLNKVLITEIFYDTYRDSEPDEYFTLYNPANSEADLGGWTVSDIEGTLWLPNNLILGPDERVRITRSAAAFYDTFGYWPDFEFSNNSRDDVRKLKVVGGLFRLANMGDELILSDFNGNAVDTVVYGTGNSSVPGWHGRAVPDTGEGRIFKRKVMAGISAFADTDSAGDWESLSEHYPRQSDFELIKFQIDNSGWEYPAVTAFTSPDSSFTAIYGELVNARKSVFVNVYQFTHETIAETLVELAENGLDVRVLLEGDPVGGLTMDSKLIAYRLISGGCQVRLMINDPDNGIHDRYSVNHAKYIIIDSETVIVLSENLKDTGVPENNCRGNRGTGIVIHDPDISSYFTDLFLEDASIDEPDVMDFNPRDKKYGFGEQDPVNLSAGYARVSTDTIEYFPRFQAKEFRGFFNVTPVISPEHSLIEHGSILATLRSAKKLILVEQLQMYRYWKDYEKPHSNLFLDALFEAAKNGCKVRILLDPTYSELSGNANDNANVAKYINKAAAEMGLGTKMEAKLAALDDGTGFNKLSKIHNKGIIVDSKIVYIGSMNWGVGAPIKNREVGVLVENSGVAGYFENVFCYDWNLTINEILKSNLDYSKHLVFAAQNSTIYFEVALLNTRDNSTLNVDLETCIHTLNSDINDCGLSARINRTRLTLRHGSVEKITISLIQKRFEKCDGRTFIELKCSAMGMNSSLLWIEVGYNPVVSLPKADNATGFQGAKPTGLRDIDSKYVLIFIITSMVLISIVRDTVGYRLKSTRQSVPAKRGSIKNK